MLKTRYSWKTTISKDIIPEWECPHCKKGILNIVKDSFHINETLISKTSHKHEDWDPSWIEGHFWWELICNNSNCKGITIIAGNMWVEEIMEEEFELNYENYLIPTFFKPALDIIPLHSDIPKVIRKTIESSFELFWIDLASAANKIRIAIELILDEKRVEKSLIRKNKRVYHTLHKRIEIFKQQQEEEAKLLLAIKWIWNDWSHSKTQLTKDDLLDAYEILEYVLDKIFERKTQKQTILKLSKAINKRKGPIRKKPIKRIEI